MIDRQAVSEAGSRKGARGNRQPGRRRDDLDAHGINQPVRLEQIPVASKRPGLRHHQPRQIPWRLPVCDHDQGT